MNLLTENGFMKDILNAFLGTLKPQEVERFKKLQSHDERVQLVYDNPYVRTIAIPKNTHRQKNLKAR